MLKKIEFVVWSGLSLLFFVFALIVLVKGFGLTKSGGGGASIIIFLVSVIYEMLPEMYGRYVVSITFAFLGVFFLFRARNTKFNLITK